MNNDHIYWVFTAAAQSVASFIALLLAGYALVHNLMEAARNQDDTLEELHFALWETHYARLQLLAWWTGFAIILNLVTAFLNHWEFNLKLWLVGFTAIVDVLAIVGGLGFVVAIVNPARYKKAAEQALEEDRRELSLEGDNRASAVSFFDAFMQLERVIRNYLRAHDLLFSPAGEAKEALSFKQMSDALLQDAKIDRGFYNELRQLTKYRNLVFHGHVDTVDQSMVDRVRLATSSIAELARR